MFQQKIETFTTVKDRTSNPGPLALCAFGLTTVLLNIHNAGGFEFNAMIIGMGIAYGGLAQVIGGIQEWCKGNGFGGAAFTSYGFFWISLALQELISASFPEFKVDKYGSAAYLFVWGLFTLFFLFAAFRHDIATCTIFSTLVVLFWLLAIGAIAKCKTVTRIAGWVGIVCGSSAMYTGLGNLVNGTYEKIIFPMGVLHKEAPAQQNKADPEKQALKQA